MKNRGENVARKLVRKPNRIHGLSVTATIFVVSFLVMSAIPSFANSNVTVEFNFVDQDGNGLTIGPATGAERVYVDGHGYLPNGGDITVPSGTKVYYRAYYADGSGLKASLKSDYTTTTESIQTIDVKFQVLDINFKDQSGDIAATNERIYIDHVGYKADGDTLVAPLGSIIYKREYYKTGSGLKGQKNPVDVATDLEVLEGNFKTITMDFKDQFGHDLTIGHATGNERVYIDHIGYLEDNGEVIVPHESTIQYTPYYKEGSGLKGEKLEKEVLCEPYLPIYIEIPFHTIEMRFVEQCENPITNPPATGNERAYIDHIGYVANNELFVVPEDSMIWYTAYYKEGSGLKGPKENILIESGVDVLDVNYAYVTLNFKDQNGHLDVPEGTGNEMVYIDHVGYRSDGQTIVSPAGSSLHYRAYYAQGSGLKGPKQNLHLDDICDQCDSIKNCGPGLWVSDSTSYIPGTTQSGGTYLRLGGDINVPHTYGETDTNVVSLGYGGEVILSFPSPVGGSLTINQKTYQWVKTLSANVYGSLDGSIWSYLGEVEHAGEGGVQFFPTSLPLSSCIQYVKLIDKTDPEIHNTYPGDEGFLLESIFGEYECCIEECTPCSGPCQIDVDFKTITLKFVNCQTNEELVNPPEHLSVYIDHIGYKANGEKITVPKDSTIYYRAYYKVGSGLKAALKTPVLVDCSFDVLEIPFTVITLNFNAEELAGQESIYIDHVGYKSNGEEIVIPTDSTLDYRGYYKEGSGLQSDTKFNEYVDCESSVLNVQFKTIHFKVIWAGTIDLVEGAQVWVDHVGWVDNDGWITVPLNSNVCHKAKVCVGSDCTTTSKTCDHQDCTWNTIIYEWVGDEFDPPYNINDPPGNQPPVVTLGDDIFEFEGTLIDFCGSFEDPDFFDSHTIEWDFGDGSPHATGTLTPSHAYGDNGAYIVTLTVTDREGESNSALLTVTVANVPPSLELDVEDAISFAGGDAFVGHIGIEQIHLASAIDPGSDDLTFTWNFGSETTCYNDGTNPDPYPSPSGIYPISADDTASVSFTEPGIYTISVTVTDDDGGSDTVSLTKIVTGSANECRTQGYWKHQFGGNGNQHIDDATLEAYLDIVNFASDIFSEVESASTLEEASGVMWQKGPGMRDKANAQLLAAWLNFANGAVYWDEIIGTYSGDIEFNEIVHAAEMILLNPDASHSDVVNAKDLAEAVNVHDEQPQSSNTSGNEAENVNQPKEGKKNKK